ncbi:MAG: trigger factor [Hungatella sp.]
MMKKVIKVCMCGLMATLLIAGCSKKAASPVKLGNYKGVTYTAVPVEVTDEQVEQQIQGLVDSNPVVTEVERAAKDGDTVNIDYVGLKDGVAFEGGTADAFDLVLGSGSFIDGFEAGLIGATKGQELSLNLTFPAEYQSEDLAGKAVVFDVTVNSVKESTPSELNDAFIQKYTEAKTVAEYRETMKADMLAQATANAADQKKSDVFMKVIEDSEVTIDQTVVDAYYNEQLANYEKSAEQNGLDLETMVSYYGMDLPAFKEQLKTMAEEATKQNAVAKAIADAEGFKVEEADKTALAEQFQYADVAAMVEQVGQTAVENYILTEKVVNFIADNAVEA